MSEREQWRFQWPDGTWIRWNPQTQSWEKEEGQGEPARAPARTEPPPIATRPAPSTPVTPTPTPTEAIRSPSGWKRLGETTAETATAPPPAVTQVDEPEPASAIVEEDQPASEPRQPEPVAESSSRAPRLGVSDVIPPREPERPVGALWPTIVAGAAVGIGVGLLLSTVVR